MTEREDTRDARDIAIQRLEIRLRELQHRVKNHLQLINSLLDLQARRAPPDARAALIDAQRRINAIARVHQELEVPTNVTSVNLRSYLGRIGQAIYEGGGKADLQLTVEVDDVTVSADAATSIGLIVNELVTNAYKHAFRSGQAGTVVVAFRQDASGAVLSVSDNGNGIVQVPEGGLGTLLVRGLTRQLQGELEVMSGPAGATFRVAMPNVSTAG